MKILSILKNKEAKQESDTIKRLRTKEIDEEYNNKLRLLNTLNDDFEKALKSQKDAYAAEKAAHFAWRKEEEEKTKELEDRKRQALLPIEEREKAVENRESKVEAIEANLKAKETIAIEMTEVLQTKLAEATETKLANEQASRLITSKMQGIEKQSESIKVQAKQLSDAMTDFILKSEEKEKELNAQRVSIKIIQDGFELREARNQAEEKKINTEWIRIADQRKILEIELNKLKL